jgi:hypothetical protein
MNKKKLKTVKEVFQFIHDEMICPEHQFICHCLDTLEFNNKISVGLSRESRKYLKSQKPSERVNTEFTEHKKWTGSYVWWCDIDEEFFEEKKRFLRHIIDKCQS